MKKRLLCLILAAAVVLLTTPITAAATESGKSVMLEVGSVYDIDYTADELRTMIATCEKNKAVAHEMADCARALGYPEDHVIIKTAGSRWWEEQGARNQYRKMLAVVEEREALRKKAAEYPYAMKVWELLEAEGFNNYVIAGILGNMMRETGGDTLALNPFWYVGNYYGLCMWDLSYTPKVAGKDIPGQIQVLVDTMPGNMGRSVYDRFCTLQDEREAALIFAQYYERCSSAGYGLRKDDATAALKFFTEG